MVISDKKELISKMTLSEKCSLLTGKGAFESQGISRLGIEGFKMNDGPNGIRESYGEMCYPSGCLIACSFDRDVAGIIGETLGEECASYGVKLLLGPAQNLKRSPLCGRNFEYYSEDPCLSGELAGAYVSGLQKYAGACVKHFFGNNQEHKRMTLNARISREALAETYLSSFERIVKKHHPDAIMSGYSKINGKYPGEDKYIVDDVLRKKWGFDGIIISDWGAVDDKILAVDAGTDIEMPANPANTEKLISAVESGEIDEKAIDLCVERYLNILDRMKKRPQYVSFDREKASDCIASAAAESMVLLKNQNNTLPIDDRYHVIGVFGEFAEKPRIQGGGSANVMIVDMGKPLDRIRERFPDKKAVYAKAFSIDDFSVSEEDYREALNVAKECDIAIVFAGLPEVLESEGYDRVSMKLPENQIVFIKELSKKNIPVVVILSNGGAVEMEWDAEVDALVESYLAGDVFAKAVTLLLSGDVNPCGRLAETVLHKLEDSSAYPYYGNAGNEASYNEGLFVGYKYYLSKGVSVKYPFGYGLSYGNVEYSKIEINDREISLELKNKSSFRVKEVIQIYVGYEDSPFARPKAELKEFKKVTLEPESVLKCKVFLEDDCFKTYNTTTDSLEICGGTYEISVRKNAEEILASKCIQLPDCSEKKFHRNSEIGEILKCEKGKEIVSNFLKPYLCLAIFGNFNTEIQMVDGEAVDAPIFNSIMKNMPLRALSNLTAGKFSEVNMDQIIEELNNVKQ